MPSMYYIALVCPDEVNDTVLNYKQWMLEQFGCKVALKSPAHITMLPPFYAEESREKEIKQLLGSFSYKAPVPVRLNGFGHFRKNVIYISVEMNPALNSVKTAFDRHILHSQLKEIKIDTREFHPHVTIANRDLQAKDFATAWKKFSTENFSAEFDIGELSLLKLSQGKWETIYRHVWS